MKTRPVKSCFMKLLAPAVMLLMLLSCDNILSTVGDDNGTTYYVNASTGLDDNELYPGTSPEAAFKTITYALTRTVAGDRVRVAPGTYNDSLGEIFPMQIPAGVSLIGDEDTKGIGETGDDETTITGQGDFNGQPCCVVPGGGSMIAGFQIGTLYPDAVGVITLANNRVTVRNCTLAGNDVNGIYAINDSSNHMIKGNNISNVTFGMFFQYGGAGSTIDGNDIKNNMGYGICILSGSNYIITGNTIEANVDSGLNIDGGADASVGTGSRILNNTITGNDANGIAINTGSNYVIAENPEINGNGINGINFSGGGTGSRIEYNSISGNTHGIAIGSGLNYVIRINTMEGNTIGIILLGNGTGTRVEYNTITYNNNYGVSLNVTGIDLGGGAQHSAGHNEFAGNSFADLYVNMCGENDGDTLNTDIFAMNNFWDTNPPEVGAGSGYDIRIPSGCSSNPVIDLTGAQ